MCLVSFSSSEIFGFFPMFKKIQYLSVSFISVKFLFWSKGFGPSMVLLHSCTKEQLIYYLVTSL